MYAKGKEGDVTSSKSVAGRAVPEREKKSRKQKSKELAEQH